MKQKRPIFSILKKSVPAALDLASQPVMWLIEAVFIGRLSAAALGGVGFALQIILVTMTLLFTLVIGATILINRHLGAGDRAAANHILGQTFTLGFLISLPIGLVWYFGSPLMFQLIQEQQLTAGTAGISGIEAGVEYLRMIALFAPVLIMNFLCVGLIRGSGDTHISMTINVTINLVNLLLTPVLIYGLFGLPRMEVKGAALAMVIAHCMGFIITLLFLRSRRRAVLFLPLNDFAMLKPESIKQLFKLGLPTTVEQLVWSVGQLVVTAFVATMGITELALHQVFLRIQAVLSMFYLGFGISAMTRMGKNIGAREHQTAADTGAAAHRIVFVFGIAVLAVMVIFNRPLLHLFFRSSDAVMSDYQFMTAFTVFALVQVPKAMNTVISGSLRGAGDITWLMWLNIVTVAVMEVGVNWVAVFTLNFGLIGVWSVQLLDEILKSSINNSRFRGGKWKLIEI